MKDRYKKRAEYRFSLYNKSTAEMARASGKKFYYH